MFLAHSRAERWWLEQVDVDPADPKALVRLDLGALAFPEPPGIGVPGPPSLHLVCTNGRHDPCCADFGRPVMRALTDAGAPDAWECSHVGGDRFAANIVCLPEGIYYGRVEPERARAVGGGLPRAPARPGPLPGAQLLRAAGAGGGGVRARAPGRATRRRHVGPGDRPAPRQVGGGAGCSSATVRRSRWWSPATAARPRCR